MAYSNIIQAPVKFIAKMPRKDFIVLVVVIALVITGIAAALIDKNKVAIAETFSDLTASVVKACDSYPEITKGGVYSKEKCGCTDCFEAEYVGPMAAKPVCECPKCESK